MSTIDKLKKQKNKKEEKKKSFSVSDKRMFKSSSEVPKGEKISEKKRYPTFVENLKSQLNNKDKTLKEYIESYKKFKQDQQSEFDNFKNRIEKDKKINIEQEKKKIFCAFLEILDNLERSISHFETSKNTDALFDGIKLIQSQFASKLKSLGVEKIKTINEPFDPSVGEALELKEISDEKKDNIVLEEILPGYKLGENLLRPAKVRVGKYMK